MANELVSKEFSKYKIAKEFQAASAENDLGAGISGGFAVVGYRGKTWSIKKGGEERPILRDDGDPRASIEVVILSSAKNLSKVWYERGYVEGNNSPPDCWSGNGVTPNPMSPKLQSQTCAACPRNVWGGRITENNKRAKECSDSKRMAVVPLNDLTNEQFGGPMLLRVPAKSLTELASYGTEMTKMGFPYYSVATKISFDAAESYPKFKFVAMRPLSGEEATTVIDMREHPVVGRILDETGDPVIDEVAVTPAPATAPVTPRVTPAAAAKKPTVTPRIPKTINATVVEDAEIVDEVAAINAIGADVDEQEANSDLEAADAENPEDEEAFDKALDAKLSAFLGGKKS